MSTGKTAVADLWRLVLASPSDTALQAEYLQVVTQEGDPFAEAEMVRLATEINEISYTRNYRWEAITKQYDRLAQRRKSEFDAKLKPWQAELSFAVGWPSEITIPARAFREYAAEVVATVPLRHLNLTEVGAAPRSL